MYMAYGRVVWMWAGVRPVNRDHAQRAC